VRLKLFFLSIVFLGLFTLYSYNVAKEKFTQLDFDTTVKLQDRLSRSFDPAFSQLSLLGSAEVTVAFCLLLSFLALIKRRWGAILGWMMIVPASAAEVFGKLVIYHPGPPVLFHRTTLATHLPSFYIHTEFSYPSGHMTRTIFITTILFCMVLFSKSNILLKAIGLALLALVTFLMAISRVYLGEHWSTDVIGGGLLGIGFGLLGYVLIFKAKKLYHALA